MSDHNGDRWIVSRLPKGWITNTITFTPDDLDKYVERRIAEAVAAEREACALYAEIQKLNWAQESSGYAACCSIAAAIRAQRRDKAMSERLTPEEQAEIRCRVEGLDGWLENRARRLLDDLEALEKERDKWKRCADLDADRAEELMAERDTISAQLDDCRNAIRNQRGDDL